MSNAKTTKHVPAPAPKPSRAASDDQKPTSSAPGTSPARAASESQKPTISHPGARRMMSTSPTNPNYKTYAQRGLGLSFGRHPELIDDCLDRAIVDMRVVTGSGNVVTDEADAQAVLHPSIVGVNTDVATGSYQVSVNYAEESGKWVVNATAGVSWSVLILKQKAKQ